MELLKFIFSSFWTFAGFTILLCMILMTLTDVISNIIDVFKK